MTQGFRQKELTTRVLHANQATFKFSHRDEKYFQELSGASQCGRGVKNLVWFRSVLRCDPTTKKYFAVSYNAQEVWVWKWKSRKKRWSCDMDGFAFFVCVIQGTFPETIDKIELLVKDFIHPFSTRLKLSLSVPIRAIVCASLFLNIPFSLYIWAIHKQTYNI